MNMMSDTQLLELRIKLGIERLMDISQNYGKGNKRVESYRKKLDKLICQLPQNASLFLEMDPLLRSAGRGSVFKELVNFDEAGRNYHGL